MLSLETGVWTATIAGRSELAGLPEWPEALGRFPKNGSYHALLADTLTEGFEHGYLVLRDGAANVRAIQPFFVVDQDIFDGCGPRLRRLVAQLRRLVPRLGRMRTLMVGCVAGEGHLAAVAEGDETFVAAALHQQLTPVARTLGARLIVLKDFAAEYRSALGVFVQDGYTRVPSMPRTRLWIGYRDFDELMSRAVSRSTRRSLRRKFRDAAATEDRLELEILSDASTYVDELYPLYLNVFLRSKLRFEKLTPEYLARVGRELPDRTRFFIWRLHGRAVAFSLCLVHGDAIHDEYIGLDYSVSPELNLYFTTLRDVIQWSIVQGYRWYYSAPLAYHPKRRLRCDLVPLDLYVTHTSRLANAALRPVLPLLTPVRRDDVLRTFPDYARMHGSGAQARTRRSLLNPYVQLTLGALLVTSAELLLRAGAQGSSATGALQWVGFAPLGSWLTWAGIVAYVLSFFSWLSVLRRHPLSVAFPAINVVHVAIPLGAWLFLGEHVPLLRWGGIGLVVTGILLVVQQFVSSEDAL